MSLHLIVSFVILVGVIIAAVVLAYQALPKGLSRPEKKELKAAQELIERLNKMSLDHYTIDPFAVIVQDELAAYRRKAINS